MFWILTPKFARNYSIAHALSRRFLKSKARVQSSGKQFGICGGKNVTCIRFSPFISAFLIYYQIGDQWLFIGIV